MEKGKKGLWGKSLRQMQALRSLVAQSPEGRNSVKVTSKSVGTKKDQRLKMRSLIVVPRVAGGRLNRINAPQASRDPPEAASLAISVRIKGVREEEGEQMHCVRSLKVEGSECNRGRRSGLMS